MSRLFHARQKLQRALADCYAEQVGDPPNGNAGPDSAPSNEAVSNEDGAPPSSEAGDVS
ncbi:MAG: hypothetical protein ABI551_20120 [Polyangiaceae bacterium]